MSNLDLGDLHKTRPHLFADALEMLVLFEDQGPYSPTDAWGLIGQSPPSEEGVIAENEDDLDGDDEEDDKSTADLTKDRQNEVAAVFRLFEWRASAFGDAYPFKINQQGNLMRKPVSTGHATYAFLLCCARLRTVGSAATRTYLAARFEELCALALSSLGTTRSSVIQFGAGTPQRAALGTDMRVAIPALASLLGTQTNPHWTEREETAQGDGGMDLLLATSLDDQDGERMTLVAQCAACEKESDWFEKVPQAKRGLSRRIHLQHPPANAIFIPGAYRGSDGKWPVANISHNVLILDRLRIMQGIEQHDVTDAQCLEWLSNAPGISDLIVAAF